MNSLHERLTKLKTQAGGAAPARPAGDRPEGVASAVPVQPEPGAGAGEHAPGAGSNGASDARGQSAAATLPERAHAPLGRRIGRLAAARRNGGGGRARGIGGARSDLQHLAEVLGGTPIGGGVVLVESRLALGSGHGHRRLGQGLSEALAYFGGGPAGAPADLVFMDTETTGLAGGTGTVVFLLGLGRIGAHDLQVRQLFLCGFRGEEVLLEAAREMLVDATTLVTYNGRSFDHPILSARYRLAGLADPFAELHHFDLLHTTRRAFGRRWSDCRLRTAEERLTGFVRVDDLPGSEAPETWFRWVRDGSTRDLPRLIEHNRWDIISLAALLPALWECYEDPATPDADVLAVARHVAEHGDEEKAYASLLGCRERLEDRALLELARMARRRGEWAVAVGIWQMLASADHPEALERLAKYHEHVTGEIETALDLTRRLILIEPCNAAHPHREQRLLARCATPAPNFDKYVRCIDGADSQ